MENVTKALTIAGTILITVIVISAFIFMFRDIRGVKHEQADNQKTQAIIDFNKSYESYDKEELLGAELLSLANKIEDYKERYKQSEGYKSIKLIIESGIDNNDIPQNTSSSIVWNKNDASKCLTSYRNYIEDLMKTYKSSNNLEALKDCIDKINHNAPNTKEYTKAEYQKKQILDKIGNIDENKIEEHYKNYEMYNKLKTEKKFKCDEIQYDKRKWENNINDIFKKDVGVGVPDDPNTPKHYTQTNVKPKKSQRKD